jgi:hypothetical protein
MNHQLLRGYTLAQEIAVYLESNLNSFTEEKALLALSYNSDKDKLELELRKLLIMRSVEGSIDLNLEKGLSN